MKKLILGLFIIFLSYFSNAQFIMEYGIASTFPLSTFSGQGYKSGLGHSLTLLTKPFPRYYNWQFQIGGNVNYFWANNAKGQIYYYVGNETYPSLADYKLKNRHSAISFKTRLSSKANPVRFYFDLDLGIRNFQTKEIIDVNDYNSEARYTNTSVSSTNFFAGITGGILFRMNRYWYLSLYTRYDYGLNCRWVDLNSVVFNTYNASYYTPKTKTPLLWTGFSTTFYFGGDGSAKKTRNSNTYSPNNTPQQPKTETPKRGNELPPIDIPKIELPQLPAPKPLPKPQPPIKPKNESPKPPSPSPGPR